MKTYKNKMLRTLNNKLTLYLGIMFTVLLVASCMEDEVINVDTLDSDSFDLPVKVAIPVAKGEVLLKQVIDELDLDDFELKSYEDGLVYFDFRDTINIGKIIDVKVPDQTVRKMVVSGDLSIPELIPIPANGSYPISSNFQFDLDVEGGEVDRAVFESGLLEIFSNNALEGTDGVEQTLYVNIIDLSHNNRVFEVTIADDEFGQLHTYDLMNHVLVTSGESEYIRASFTYTLTNTTDNVIFVPKPESLYFEFVMKDVVPRFVEGFFGTKVLYSGNSIVDLEIIDTEFYEDSTIFFKDPKVNLSLINPVGMPFSVNVEKLRLINVFKKDTVDLDFDPDSLTVPGGTVNYVGQTDLTIVPEIFTQMYDKNNSNIDEVFGRVYDEVSLNYNVVANPEGRIADLDNVIRFDSSEIYLETHAVLPLWVKAQNLTYEDTVDFDFEEEVLNDADFDTTNIDYVDSIKVIINLENSIPIEVQAQLYMLDEQYNVVDSLFPNKDNLIIKGAEINSEGETTAKGYTSIKLVYGPEKKDLWRPCKYVYFRGNANTVEKQYVKIYDNVGIGFYVGFEACGQLNDGLLDDIE